MRILVSAGPTREFFDTVRFISNPSTGKMGYALAREAARRGHQVTLVTGPVNLRPPSGVETIPVVTAAEMASACKRVFRRADVAIMTAAVCDYRPVEYVPFKLKKSDRPLSIVLEATEDIAATLGRQKGRRLLVAFAMEDRNARANAESKYLRKNCDLIVLNGPENVGSDIAVVEFFARESGWSPPYQGTKHQVARRLLQILEAMTGHAPRGARAEQDTSKPKATGPKRGSNRRK